MRDPIRVSALSFWSPQGARRALIGALLLSLAALPASLGQESGAEKPPAFRGLPWGSTPEQVLAKEEGEPAHRDQSQIIYRGEIAGLKAMIGYTFLDGLLAGGGYRIAPGDSANRLIHQWETLRDLLTKKYGPPIDVGPSWDNPLFKEDRSRWGTALRLGHLTFSGIWETEVTRISGLLSMTGGETSFGLAYHRLSTLEADEEAEKKKALEDL